MLRRWIARHSSPESAKRPNTGLICRCRPFLTCRTSGFTLPRTSSICAFSLNLLRSTACQRCNTAHQRGVPQPRGSRTRIDPWQSIELPLRGAYRRDYRNAVEQRMDWSFVSDHEDLAVPRHSAQVCFGLMVAPGRGGGAAATWPTAASSAAHVEYVRQCPLPSLRSDPRFFGGVAPDDGPCVGVAISMLFHPAPGVVLKTLKPHLRVGGFQLHSLNRGKRGAACLSVSRFRHVLGKFARGSGHWKVEPARS